MSAVNAVAVIDKFADFMRDGGQRDGEAVAREAGVAVADLIKADRAYDVSKARLIEANNRIAAGARSDDEFREQASAQHAYDRAVDQRRAALARVGGAA